MTWHFEQEDPNEPSVLTYGFIGVTHFDRDLYWSPKLKRWTTLEECHERRSVASSIFHCKSYKSCLRHLKEHPELKGVKTLRFIHRFKGCDILATWRDE